MASSVKFSGTLYSHRHTFQAAAQHLNQNAKDAVEQIAELYKMSLLSMIDDGSKTWSFPSTPYYTRKKAYFQAKHGLPPSGPWVKTGELRSKIISKTTQDGFKRHRAWAGFEEGKHSSGFLVSELVDILDGSMPLIEPAWVRIEGQAKNILGNVGVGIFR